MQFKLRYWVRLLSAFLSRFRGVLFVGVVIGLLLFSFLSLVLPRVMAKSVEYIGIAGRYHTDELPRYVLEMMGEGLTKISDDGQALPALASEWQSSSDGTEWTFKIAEGKVWHDNTPVTAETIQYSFEDAQMQVLDEKTVRFTLKSPFSPFPMAVSRPTFKRGLLGTGEWRVQDIRLAGSFAERIVLKNEQGDKKIIRFYPSEDTLKTAFQLGEIDVIPDLIDPFPFSSWTEVSLNQNIRRDRVVVVFLNSEDPAVGGVENRTLRHALSYAINKEEFEGPRAISPVSPDSWAYNSLVKDYAFEPERAKEMIGDKGDLEISLTTIPVLLPTAERIKSDWENAGVKVNIQVVSVLPETFQAFLAIYDIPKDPDQYSIWHSTQTATNISRYSNPRIDTLLENGRLELDTEERKRTYLDFQRFLLEDAPAIFLYHPVSYSLSRR